MNIHEPSKLLEEKGIKMEEEFQIHQKLVHDQEQPNIEKEADSSDQTDDIFIDNKLESSEIKKKSKEMEKRLFLNQEEQRHLKLHWRMTHLLRQLI